MTDEPKRFSFGNFIAGGVLGMFVGVVGNVVAMSIAGALFGRSNAHNPALGFLIGILPGVGLIFVSRNVSRSGLAQGLLTASIFILLTGGLCGGGVAGLFG